MITFQCLFLKVLAELLVTTYISGWHLDLRNFNSPYRLERLRLYTNFLKYQRSWQCLLLAGRLHFEPTGLLSNAIHLASDK